jgi:hypothetical protein
LAYLTSCDTEIYFGAVEEAPMDSRIERQRAIVAEHIRCENAHDWPAVYDTFVQDDRAFYDVVPLKASFKGIEGVRQFYETIARALPDLHIEVTAQYDAPGCTICETSISGTNLGHIFIWPQVATPSASNSQLFTFSMKTAPNL